MKKMLRRLNASSAFKAGVIAGMFLGGSITVMSHDYHNFVLALACLAGASIYIYLADYYLAGEQDSCNSQLAQRADKR